MLNRFEVLSSKLMVLASTLVFSLALYAQTFDDPDAESEDGLEAEFEESISEPNAQLDESLVEEYLEESQPEEVSEQPLNEAPLSAGSDLDTFIPSEDISEDFSVPFPVDI